MNVSFLRQVLLVGRGVFLEDGMPVEKFWRTSHGDTNVTFGPSHVVQDPGKGEQYLENTSHCKSDVCQFNVQKLFPLLA